MTDTKFGRFLSFVEGIAFAAFVAFYIWRLQITHPNSWMILPIWLVVSFVAHHDTPKTLGWRADNLWAATRQAALVLGVCMIGVAAAGLYFGALHRMPVHLIDSHRFFGYFSFCLLQQIALNSYLMERFLSAVQRPWAAAFLSGVVFSALHWPNPVLVPLTFVGGFAMCWLFARQRNILPLTLGQAMLGGLVWWAFPLAWHHSMRVGPGYYAFGSRLW
jgi:membrane protease YdiL (CAAX protease family)